jgi:hypothetical protein
MLKKEIHSMLLLFILVAMIIGCSPQQPIPSQFISSANDFTVTTENGIVTITPSITPILNWTPTLTRTKKPDITFAPTLTENERQNYITNLIQNPGDCRLPCWWGLEPGVTSWQKVINFFYFMGQGYPISSTDNFLDPALDFAIPWILHRMTINSDGEVIKSIIFTVDGSYDFQGFKAIWGLYTPEKVLEKYGKPSRILISVEPWNLTNGTRIGYELWLFYDVDGFLIRYSSLGEIKNDNAHICPSFDGETDIWTVDLYLQSPENTAKIEYLAGGLRPYNLLPIDDATGLNIDDMMSLVDGTIKCIDSPKAIW